MAWKTHGRQRYYYRTRWDGTRNTTEYVGGGARGERAAREDAERRLQRRSDEMTVQRRLAEVDAAAEPLRALERTMTWLIRGVLIVAGHYLHRGHEWRRRAA